MKKNLGLLIAFIGICIAAGAMIFTPDHTLNAGDSVNGLHASAPLFFSALIVFGAGVVVYANSIAPNSKRVD